MIAATPSTHRRISVLTPLARLDVVVPGGLPVAELVPVVADLARIGEDAGGDGWQLGRVGRAALSPEQSLDSAGIRDGDLLDLRPSSLTVVGPVHDEITDVVAAVAAERVRRWSLPRRLTALPAGAVLLGGAVGWAWWHRAAAAGTGAALAVVLLVAAVLAARRHRPLLATGLGAASIAFAAVAAAGIVATGVTVGTVVAGTAMIGAPLVGLATRTGLPVFTALTAAGAGVVAGSVATQAFSLSTVECAVGVVVVGTSLLPVVPRWSARIAGLGRRSGAGSTDGVAPTGVALDAMLIAARRGLSIALGLDAAAACLVTGAALVLIRAGGPWSVSLAAIALLLVLLRSRAVDVPGQAMALSVPAVLGLIAGAALLAPLLPPVADPWVPIGAAAAAAGALLFGCADPGRAGSPAAQRVGRLLEGALVLAVVPVAVAAVQGYSRLRHL